MSFKRLRIETCLALKKKKRGKRKNNVTILVFYKVLPSLHSRLTNGFSVEILAARVLIPGEPLLFHNVQFCHILLSCVMYCELVSY